MSQILHRRSGPHRFLCVVLAALTAATPATVTAQQAVVEAPQDPAALPKPDTTLLAGPAPAPAPLDLTYVSPNACVIAAVRPAQLLSSPAMALMPVEVLQAAMIKELGIDPLTAEQLIISGTPPTQGPPSYAVFAKFNAPVTLKRSEMTAHTQQGTVGSTLYLQSREPMKPSFYQPSATTLVAAPDFVIQQFSDPQLAAPAPDSLTGAFAAAAQGDDLLAMIAVEPLRPLINMALAQAPMPPEFPQLRDLPNLVKTIELRANVSRPGATELIVTANNEADAQRLVRMFDDAKKILASHVAVQAQASLASADPVEQAGGRYLQRMIKYSDEQLQLVREGDRIVLARADMHGNKDNQVTYIATIGVLVALLLPAVQAAREAARRNASLNNVKQIMLALLNHESAHLSFPAYANFSPDGKPLLSWRVHILPYLEQQALYEQFHLDEPWDSEHNRTLIAKMPLVYLDPSSKLPPTDGKTSYLGVKGEGRFFDGAEGRKIASIRDGTAATIAVVQVDDGRAVEWTKPDDWEMDDNAPLAGFGNLHAGGVFIAGFCDGHVTSIYNGIDGGAFKAMLTVGGGEANFPNP